MTFKTNTQIFEYFVGAHFTVSTSAQAYFAWALTKAALLEAVDECPEGYSSADPAERPVQMTEAKMLLAFDYGEDKLEHELGLLESGKYPRLASYLWQELFDLCWDKAWGM